MLNLLVNNQPHRMKITTHRNEYQILAPERRKQHVEKKWKWGTTPVTLVFFRNGKGPHLKPKMHLEVTA